MSLIEQAAKRLEQLRNAGLSIPEQPPAPNTVSGDRHVDGKFGSPPQPDSQAGFQGARNTDGAVAIDLVKLEAAGFLTPNSPRSQLAEEFRIIKRPLISNAFGKGAGLVNQGNLIMVTSALPREGKTFTAINLAISMAMEMDTTVMLVDADVAKPSILESFGIPQRPGLLDVLTDDAITVADVLIKTNIEKLTILPSGNMHDRATELLASEAMVHLLEEMGNRYKDRVIIFDSPPLLVTTESRALASHVGQIVMVSAAEKTMQSQVKGALAMIDACPVKLMVLNQARPGPLDKYGYGYGYGYGHSYGYGQESGTGPNQTSSTP